MLSKCQLNKLYQEILSRDIDDSGFQEYQNKEHDIVKLILLKSAERSYNIKTIISDIYTEVIHKPCDCSFVNMILQMNPNITTSQLRQYYSTLALNTNDNLDHPIKLLDQWIVPFWISVSEIKLMLQSLLQCMCENLNVPQLYSVLEKNLFVKSNEFRLLPHLEIYNDNDITNPWNFKDKKVFQYEVFNYFIIALWKNYHRISAPTDGTQEITIKLREIFLHNDFSWNILCSKMNKYISDLIFIRVCGLIPKYSQPYNFQNFEQNKAITDALVIRKKYNSIQQTLQQRFKVVVMIPYLEDMHASFIHIMKQKVNEMISRCKNIEFTLQYDNQRMKKQDNDYTPWSRVKRIRNKMVSETNMENFDYALWIDADMVEYPADFPERAISINPSGITAPLALIEKTTTFYDWCGYVPQNKSHIDEERIGYIYGRQIGLIPPYLPINVEERKTYISDMLNDKLDDNNPIIEMDCVGCMYLMPAHTFKLKYKNETKDSLRSILDKFNVKHHLDEDQIWYEDHPSFTDHFSICSVIRDNGHKVIMDKASAAYHADLPKYNSGWH